MAIARVATRDQNPVSPLLETLEYQQGIDPPRAGDTDDANVGRISDATGSCHIGTGIATPIAQKTYDLGLVLYRQSAVTSANNC